MMVSGNGTSGFVDQQAEDVVWKRFHEVSKEKRDILVSDEMPLKIEELQEKLTLALPMVGVVSFTIRRIFFDEVTLSDAEVVLKDALTSNGDDANKSQAIVQFIQKEILTIKPVPEVEDIPDNEPMAVVQMAHLPLLQALSKYEQLGNQLITRERIRVKSQGEPVRPSLLYWIKYYRDELGIGHHDTVQRGNFLFRSENGKRLSPEERERVSLVFKSVEENIALDIDTERSEIVFPPFVAQPQSPAPTPQHFRVPPIQASFRQAPSNDVPGAVKEVPAGGGTLSFSSHHVFGAELDRTAPIPQKVAPPVSAPVAQTPPPKANPFHIRPVSLGKEE